MSKHVPAPWEISKFCNDLGGKGGIAIDAIDPVDGKNFEVCEVWGINTDNELDDRSRANAKLIAAAPELLKALQYAIKQERGDVGCVRDWKFVAEEAIAKAIGESK